MIYSEQQEREYVLGLFRENISKYADRRIALYGMGVNTFYILNHRAGFHIVALMDAKQEGSVVEGLPVISVEDAKRMVDVIVIIARAGVVPIIYQRIAAVEESGVSVVDIWGNAVNHTKWEEKIAENSYWDKDFEDLKAAIDAREVITFDVFDTLIMRKVMRPSDLYEITGRLIEEEFELDWKELRRKAAEIAAGKYIQPDYDEIYKEFQQISNLNDEKTEQIKRRELEIDLAYMVPRYAMVDALEYALKKGKRVFLLTDMYYTKNNILYILEHFHINGFEDLLVSCNERKCKWPDGELFDVFLDRFHIQPDIVLHVGDNPTADIELARKKGMEAYHILSAYEMLVQSAFSSVLIHARTQEDYLVIGMMLAECCNNPFALSKTRGKCFIDNLESFGYLVYGACFSGFVVWLLRKYKGSDKDYILFLARDGYPVNRIYHLLAEEKGIQDIPKGMYVIASRRALGVASIVDENSFAWALGQLIPDVSGKPRLVLQNRFGISPDADDERADADLSIEELREYIRGYKDVIIENGRKEQAEYLAYLKSEGIAEDAKVVVFDTKTSGTAAYYFANVTGLDTELVCYILLNNVDYTLYDPDKSYAYIGQDTNGMMRYNYTRLTSLNECVYTSDKPQLLKFEGGIPVFSEPEYSQIYFEEICKVHEGIERFAGDYAKLSGHIIDTQNISPELVDDMLGCLRSGAWIVKEELKKYFAHQDKFGGDIKQNYAF